MMDSILQDASSPLMPGQIWRVITHNKKSPLSRSSFAIMHTCCTDSLQAEEQKLPSLFIADVGHVKAGLDLDSMNLTAWLSLSLCPKFKQQVS